MTAISSHWARVGCHYVITAGEGCHATAPRVLRSGRDGCSWERHPVRVIRTTRSSCMMLGMTAAWASTCHGVMRASVISASATPSDDSDLMVCAPGDAASAAVLLVGGHRASDHPCRAVSDASSDYFGYAAQAEACSCSGARAGAAARGPTMAWAGGRGCESR